MRRFMLFASVLMVSPELLSATISNVTAKQRYPWNNLVDVRYEIVGGSLSKVRLYATDRNTGILYLAQNVELPVTEGRHCVTWDFSKFDTVKSDRFVFSVDKDWPYCVIDLSGGPSVENYPVAYQGVSDIPEQWSDEYKTTKLVLRLIEPGTFSSYSTEDGKMGPFPVELTKAFYIGIFEVTQKQFELVMGTNPSKYTGDTRPVERVSWNAIRGVSSQYDWPTIRTVDPSTFIGRLQQKTKLNFDLPTEAQWEYACRAGTTTDWNNNTYATGYGKDNNLEGLGRYISNSIVWSSSGTLARVYQHSSVGEYAPNSWGLYDMHGNVWEWCLDRWKSWKNRELNALVVDPEGPSATPTPYGISYDRVLRGGSWYDPAEWCVSSYRKWKSPDAIWDLQSKSNGYELERSIGFRLSRTLQQN